MNPRVVGIGCVLMGLWLATAGGCSTLLEWDSAGMPCEQEECLSGYSCLEEVCIVEGSLAKGTECNADVQCGDGFICGEGGCAVPCEQWFEPGNECPEGEYCEEQLMDEEYRGYCVAGSEVCRTFPGDPCDDDDLRKYCVEMSTDVFACMRSCDISWDGEAGTGYKDTCDRAEGVEICQPLGLHGQLVCREERLTSGVVGQSCDNVVATCSSGYGCVEGTCQLYCDFLADDSEQCGATGLCCEEFKYALCREGNSCE